MSKTKHTIVINGRLYDAATGLPLPKTSETAKKPVVQIAIKPTTAPSQHKPKKTVIISDVVAPIKVRPPASHLKPKVQRSLTLRRSVLKKPSSSRRPVAQKVHKKIERSHRISRFAPPKETSNVQQKQVNPAVDPDLESQAKQLQAAHEAVVKKQTSSKPVISSRAIKEHLLKQQLEKAPLELHHDIYQAGQMSARARFMSVATTSLALVLLGGYLTYINIPNLSIRVAAANAGIDASLPRYQPEGYRIRGPIAYTDGQVKVDYQQNGGEQKFSLIQKASDWDPAATLDNYVKPTSNGDYEIRSSQGLTVYTYDNRAVWVNGGILHVIDASIPLTNQQVEKIAVSM